ncbi:MAG: hypothetical protein ACKOSR_07400 [Flavobacteriales bacterium]
MKSSLNARLLILPRALILGCKKEEVPVAPVISIESISAYNVEEYNNAIEVIIHYEDHQGDIGTIDTDEHSLFVADDRFSAQDGYHIDPLTPGQQELHIRGTLKVVLRPLFIMGNDSSEETRLTFELLDRDGNTSNRVTSNPITITRE